MQRLLSIGIMGLLLLSAGGAWSKVHLWQVNTGPLGVRGIEDGCGHLELAQDINTPQTHYMCDTEHTLAYLLDGGLTIKSDVKKHIDEEEKQEHYHKTYAPRRRPLKFQKPVFGQAFQMECPLEGSHPTTYYWRKYETIDMAAETNFTADVHFSASGHVWYVDVVTAEHNGMYVCSAENEKGQEEYVDTTNFFLSVSGCPYHAPDVSFTVTPASNMTYYREGASVELTCTVVAVEEHQQPFWWKEHDNGSMSLCTRQGYMLKRKFEQSACRWTSTLTIPYFTSESAGKYHCTVDTNGVSRRLKFDDGSTDQYKASLITLIVVVFLSLTVKKQIECTEEPSYDCYTYDAFISAHDEAKDFVLETILPSLESGPSPYRLCWHSRDFLPGIPIMEQIVKTMAQSRKIIFVFSENFRRSEFCRVELELAMNRYMNSSTRCILPVTMAGRHVPIYVSQTLTYLPILAAEDSDVAGKIAKVIGQPIPVMVERLNNSFVDEE